REGVEEPELCRRQRHVLAVHIGLEASRIDDELLYLDRLAALHLLGPDSAPGGDPGARDELGHRERLHEVVVRSDLERMHPVLLAAAGADHDDRGADALAPGGLDQLPAIA